MFYVSILSMEEHLKGLNPEQREAALHMKGPLLIVAGAGAGKTKTITHRIVNLIKNGVPPEKILAVKKKLYVKANWDNDNTIDL